MSKRHRLVVEFASAKDMQRFAAEVRQCGGVATAIGVHPHRFTVTEYRPGTSNRISGNVSGPVVQAKIIESGVNLP
jgi:hypothetical protein